MALTVDSTIKPPEPQAFTRSECADKINKGGLSPIVTTQNTLYVQKRGNVISDMSGLGAAISSAYAIMYITGGSSETATYRVRLQGHGDNPRPEAVDIYIYHVQTTSGTATYTCASTLGADSQTVTSSGTTTGTWLSLNTGTGSGSLTIGDGASDVFETIAITLSGTVSAACYAVCAWYEYSDSALTAPTSITDQFGYTNDFTPLDTTLAQGEAAVTTALLHWSHQNLRYLYEERVGMVCTGWQRTAQTAQYAMFYVPHDVTEIRMYIYIQSKGGAGAGDTSVTIRTPDELITLVGADIASPPNWYGPYDLTVSPDSMSWLEVLHHNSGTSKGLCAWLRNASY